MVAGGDDDVCVFVVVAQQQPNVHLSRDIMIFITDPAFDRTVSASVNDIRVKSTPSTSKILSFTLNLPYADEFFSTSLINIPCKGEKIRSDKNQL